VRVRPSLLIAVCLLGALASCGRERRPLTSPTQGCEVSPDTLNFGEVLLQHQVQKEITLTNTGSQDLDLRVSGPEEPFEVVFLDTTVVLRPGQSKAATVTFSPQATGPYASTIHLGSDFCQDIYCTGTGMPPHTYGCEVHPSSIDFGYVHVDNMSESQFTIRNVGTEALTGSVAAGCPDFSIVEGSGPFTLAASDSVVVAVRFNPSTRGEKVCTISLGSDYCSTVTCEGKAFEGETWDIFPDGSGDAPTIQAGIDSSADGDTVLVEQGTYFESIYLGDKEITLRGRLGAESTIIDGSKRMDSVVTIGPGATRKTVVSDFTITGGTGSARYPTRPGGGIFVDTGSPVIENNHVIGNTVEGLSFGGGIYIGDERLTLASTYPLVRNNTIEDNVARLGGGIAITWGSAAVRDNAIIQNQAETDGGGVFVWGDIDRVSITGNEFTENTAGDHGGGIASWNDYSDGLGYVEILFNLFVRNVAMGSDYGETGTGGGIHIWGRQGLVRNNTIVFNRSATDCEGGGLSVIDLASHSWTIDRNIIAYNSPDGVSCRSSSLDGIRDNLLFGNDDSDRGCLSGSCDLDGSNRIEDPRFCNPAEDDYSVSADSPALAGPEPIGYATTPGCN